MKMGREDEGVDSTDSSDDAVDSAVLRRRNTGAVVVVSGPTDYITGRNRVECVKERKPSHGGFTGWLHPLHRDMGAFVAVNPDAFDASMHAMALWESAAILPRGRRKERHDAAPFQIRCARLTDAMIDWTSEGLIMQFDYLQALSGDRIMDFRSGAR